ncbi:hypothetical protein ACN20G_25575 [Streptomyces sp. BI20]|uniref:hypothetical protein n=1 Tax=Streptomyces sp. BI20 TaxID=3403460 RepID=UPI003C773B81
MTGRALRAFPRALAETEPGAGLAGVAERLGIALAEAEEMADWWVRRGRIARTDLSVTDCAGCVAACPVPAAKATNAGCAAGPARPGLTALTLVPPPSAPRTDEGVAAA